jgi:hypothetical protein
LPVVKEKACKGSRIYFPKVDLLLLLGESRCEYEIIVNQMASNSSNESQSKTGEIIKDEYQLTEHPLKKSELISEVITPYLSMSLANIISYLYSNIFLA